MTYCSSKARTARLRASTSLGSWATKDQTLLLALAVQTPFCSEWQVLR